MQFSFYVVKILPTLHVIINGQSTIPPLRSSLTEGIAYMAPNILQPDGGGCPAAAKLILQRTNLFAKRGLSED